MRRDNIWSRDQVLRVPAVRVKFQNRNRSNSMGVIDTLVRWNDNDCMS